jgi:hypothetical protein
MSKNSLATRVALQEAARERAVPTTAMERALLMLEMTRAVQAAQREVEPDDPPLMELMS